MNLNYTFLGVFLYYIIGFIVSAFFIWRYRYSKYATKYKLSDSIMALIGPWIWPFQICYFLYSIKTKIN
jgi:uncharacterized membrane protein YwaF